MPLFDDIGKKIKQTSQEATQKAKNVTTTMKLSSMISDEEKRINNSFSQIGKLYFETYKNNPQQIFAELIAGINDSKAKITSYSEQIKQIKGVARCPKCGNEVTLNASFCCFCGSPMCTSSIDASIENGVLCEKCGVRMTADKLFCTNCGNKMKPT